MVAKASKTVLPKRARFLWIGNLCLAAGFAFSAATSDDSFGRWLAVFLVVLSLAIAVTWYRLDRRARVPTADVHDQPH